MTTAEIIDYANEGGTRTYYSNYSIVGFNSTNTDANSWNITREENILDDVFTILFDTSAPVITSHSVSASHNSATISWVLSEAGNASLKYRKKYGEESWTDGGSLDFASAPSFTISGLFSSTEYEYSV